MSNTRRVPLARSTDLIIEEVGDEVLIYDTKTDRGHSLSPEAAKVWRCCDGTTSVEHLSANIGLEPDTVNRALDELRSCELLELSPTIVADGSTRREVTLRLAKVGAAAAAAPLILSVAAPTPAMAATLSQCLRATPQGSQNCGASGCVALGCCCCVPALSGGQKTCVPDSSFCEQFGHKCTGNPCTFNCSTTG